MAREEEEEAGIALTAPQPQHEGSSKAAAPMQEEGSKAVVPVVPGPPHHTLQNDSGYSSYVLTSPEPSLPGTALPRSSSFPSLTPEAVGSVATRLTSTPHNSASQDVFHLPLPKIEAIGCVVVTRSRYNSTSDSPVTTTIQSHSPIVTTKSSTATTLEMHELEMTCEKKSSNIMPEGTRVRPGKTPQETAVKELIHNTHQRVKIRSRQTPQDTPSRNKANLGLKMPPPATKRALNRLRRPQSAFVRLLREADYLVRRVLLHLSGEDLLRLSQVNRQLRQLILNDKTLGDRRMSHLTTRKSDRDRVGKENYKLKRLNTEGNSSSLRTLSPRKELSAIQNLCGNSSPEKVAPPPPLAERFIEEGKKLTKGEELQKCVKCKSPAVVHRSQLRATCSLKTCSYDYCISCHLPIHRRPQDCLSLRPRTRQATAGIFSNRCKKNLRRL